ncbi:hypothetical protein Plhal703r1_c09g0046571 [Plasmopara halstedii]
MYLREIAFSLPDDGMVLLRSCFVNYKMALEANRSAADTSSSPALDQMLSFKISNTSNSLRFVSSLRKSIRQLPPDSALDDAATQDTPLRTASYYSDNIPYDNDVSSPEWDFTKYMNKKMNTPQIRPTASIWAQASTIWKALHGRKGSVLVEAKSFDSDFNTAEGTALAAGLFKSNKYNPTCLKRASTPSYVSMIAPEYDHYDVERIIRLKLFQYVDLFLNNLSDRLPPDQLAVIQANPGIMLPAIAFRDRLDTIAHYHVVCRLFSLCPPKYKYFAQTHHWSCKANLASKQEGSFRAFCWDLVLHVMAPTVNHDPLKLYVITDAVPHFLVDQSGYLPISLFGC